jgi:hypothetical protein
MRRVLAYAVGLAILVSAGVVRGMWNGRWASSTAYQERVARVHEVPTRFGDWEARESNLDERTLQSGGIASYVSRSYRNQKTGETIGILLVCGRPGPISVHTPEVCYPGTGFDQVGETVRVPVGAGLSDEFWSAEFNKRGSVVPLQIRILYAWNADGVWKASNSPRWDFGGTPALYKLYVIEEKTPAGDQRAARDGLVDFVRVLVPEVQKALFPRR